MLFVKKAWDRIRAYTLLSLTNAQAIHATSTVKDDKQLKTTKSAFFISAPASCPLLPPVLLGSCPPVPLHSGVLIKHHPKASFQNHFQGS